MEAIRAVQWGHAIDFWLMTTQTLRVFLFVFRLCCVVSLLPDELHWLNVHARIEYKLGMMVYRCLCGQAPQYPADHLIPASDAAPRRLRLRSANLNRLTVHRCRLKHVRLLAFLSSWPDSQELVAR